MTAIAARRPARINPDTLPVLIVAVVLTTGLAASSFALTFAALLDVAGWANVNPALAWAVPVMLDAAIVVYTLAVLVHRARRERAITEWAALAGFTGVSVVANAAHAGAVPVEWQAIIGTVVAGLAPVAVLLATHTIARLIVAPVTDADTIRDSRIVDTAASADGGTEDVDVELDADASVDVDVRTAAVAVPVDTNDGADTDADTDADDEDGPRPSAPAPVVDAPVAVSGRPVVVRRHSGPRPRGGVRAVDRMDDIVRLRRAGLSVRAIAEQVGLGKSAVAKLLQSADVQAA